MKLIFVVGKDPARTHLHLRLEETRKVDVSNPDGYAYGVSPQGERDHQGARRPFDSGGRSRGKRSFLACASQPGCELVLKRDRRRKLLVAMRSPRLPRPEPLEIHHLAPPRVAVVHLQEGVGPALGDIRIEVPEGG